jgi:hypothetical protein
MLPIALTVLLALSRKIGTTQECIDRLGPYNDLGCSIPSVPCCQALASINTNGCFCNELFTTLNPDVPAVASVCFGAEYIEGVVACADGDEGLCGVVPWELEQQRYEIADAFNSAIATLSDDPSTANRAIVLASLSSAMLSSTVFWIPFIGSVVGPTAATELLGTILSTPIVLLKGTISVTPTIASDSISLVLSTTDAEWYNTVYQTSLTAKIHVKYYPCVAVPSYVTLTFDDDSVNLLSRVDGNTHIAQSCTTIQAQCTGGDKQFDTESECVAFMFSIPAISPSCANQPFQGNSSLCRTTRVGLLIDGDHCDVMGASGGDICTNAVCAEGEVYRTLMNFRRVFYSKFFIFIFSKS